MCELTGQLAACKVCTARLRELEAEVERLRVELHTTQVCHGEAVSLMKMWEAEAIEWRLKHPAEFWGGSEW